MNLQLRPSNVWHVVDKRKALSTREIKAEVLRGEGTAGEFTLMSTPAPSSCRTAFKVCANRRQLLVAVALFDTPVPIATLRGIEALDEIEIFFDPYHDHLGYFQFLFTADGQANARYHLPYPESHSTSFPRIALKKHRWETGSHGMRWLFAWFDSREIFRDGDRCGFNVARQSSPTFEGSSWNHCSGNGFPDATSFGHLYLGKEPAQVELTSATLEGNVLTLQGRKPATQEALACNVADPLGDELPLRVSARRGSWSASVRLERRTHGRYRICPKTDGRPIEPEYTAIDLPARRRRQDFSLAMTYDIPDNFVSGYYTRERLDEEMSRLQDWGIQRLYWIEYGDFPSLFAVGQWRAHSSRTFRDCGNLLPIATELAKRKGLELYAIFKPFDMGLNGLLSSRRGKGLVAEIEGKRVPVAPEIAAHQELTMQHHPDWSSEAAAPITRLKFYSRRPLGEVRSQDVRIWLGRENRGYRPYRERFEVRQGVERRPHLRWSPAGSVREKGTQRNWFLELDGLDIRTPFLAVEIAGRPVHLVNQAFAFAEATDASGNEVPILPSTGGDLTDGFVFWKEWPGWGNHSEKAIEMFEWTGAPLAIHLGKPPNLPTLLEPSFEGARRIWLERVREIFDGGADAVDIRTLCHHNACFEWLRYAFAEPVRETFRGRYGRQVQPCEEDYERVRRIRGEFYTEFLREAKKLASQYGKRLGAHLECGVEVPPDYDTRMQLHLDWETWIRDDILDDITLKFWCSQSPFIHERVLPLARRKGIPVTICDRNGYIRCTRGIEMAERLVGEAYEAGFSGYAFYETHDYLQLNPEGVPTAVLHAEAAVSKARDALEAFGARQPR